MKRKNIGIIIMMVTIPFIFIILRNMGLFNLYDLKNSRRCQEKNEAKEIALKGIIVEKYEDSYNHNIRTISIKNSEGEIRNTTILAADNSTLYEIIQLGNAIKKEKGSLLVEINNGEQKVKLNYDCKQ